MVTPEVLKSIYLDHAATTPVDAAVWEAMAPYFSDQFANAASLHRAGVQARLALQRVTQSVAQGLNTSPESIIWTSGGTESNNLAILGVCGRYQSEHGQPGHLIVSSIEHSAVLAVGDHLERRHGWRVTRLPVTSEGVVLPEILQAALTPETALVSIMHGNNEIGTVQPIAALGAICRAHGVGFHTDAVQTFGKVPLDLSQLPIDYLSASGHKIYGPKGVGLLWVHPEAVTPEPLIFGGSQQGGLRPGTENIAGVIGFAKAFELATSRMTQETPRLYALQDRLIRGLQDTLGDRVVINGPLTPEHRVPGNVHVSVLEQNGRIVEGESLVLKLDLKGFAVASGSACHSGALTPSHVVLALGKSEALARATLRFSMGRDNTAADVDRLLNALTEVLP